MQAFLGISVWVALVTVCPGLVTLAVIYLSVALLRPEAMSGFLLDWKGLTEWTHAGLALTVMILTQALGVLLERVMVRRRLLGPERETVSIPEGIDPDGARSYTLERYQEYEGLYMLLAELDEHEDTQGHLQRAVAQFFLSNNTLVSFAIGICVTLALLIQAAGRAEAATLAELAGSAYLAGLVAALVVSHEVAVIRFGVMGKALWAARRARLPRLKLAGTEEERELA